MPHFTHKPLTGTVLQVFGIIVYNYKPYFNEAQKILNFLPVPENIYCPTDSITAI